MEGVVTSMAGVAGSAIDDTLFAGAGSILGALAKLAAELYTSREMCEDLIASLEGLQPHIEQMLASGHATTTTNALTLYEALLQDIQSFLEDHIRSGRLTRMTKHWAMKKRIKDFHVERARIETLLQFEFMSETAEHHAQLTDMVENVAQVNERIEQQHAQGLKQFERMISDISMTTVSRLDDTRVTVVEALADLKHDIKSHAAEYSAPELELMKKLFLAGCESYKIPRKDLSLPHWYVSRSEIRFDRTNPFATGNFHSLHYGTLDSGARVAVNIVNAEPEDTKVRERFVLEVNTVSLLRDPHIVPFFGANHVGAPLLYITALAANGDYRNFLKSHPDRFWQLFLDAARGLAYLHNNKVVHGNLKCSNLLVLADGTGVVSDFKFAFVRASSALSLKTKPAIYDWTAPECLGVGEDANPRFESDVYSLGLCMVEAVTGHRPFDGVNETDEATRDRIRAGQLPEYSGLPPSVEHLVAKMCAREYSDRSKLSEVIRILEVLAAKERIMLEASVCGCDATTCGSCGRPSRVVPQQTQVDEKLEQEIL